MARRNGIIWMKKTDGKDDQIKKKNQACRPISNEDFFLLRMAKGKTEKQSGCVGEISGPAETR